jgi:uncharacterized membrane protein YkvA (DUF1232 family)
MIGRTLAARDAPKVGTKIRRCMGTLARIVIAVAVALALAWVGLVVYLWLARPERDRLSEGMRLLPDAVRLLRRIAGDRTVRRSVRVRLWLLFAYLAFPIDLVPDFIPVLGYVDDVIVVAATLRSVVRGAGADVVRRHWPGSADGLAALWRLARLPGEP